MGNIFEKAMANAEEVPRSLERHANQIVAVFKGQDGSMGFKYNQRYELIVSRSSIRRVEAGPWIPYGSLEAFFQNWIVTGSH